MVFKIKRCNSHYFEYLTLSLINHLFAFHQHTKPIPNEELDRKKKKKKYEHSAMLIVCINYISQDIRNSSLSLSH